MTNWHSEVNAHKWKIHINISIILLKKLPVQFCEEFSSSSICFYGKIHHQTNIRLFRPQSVTLTEELVGKCRPQSNVGILRACWILDKMNSQKFSGIFSPRDFHDILSLINRPLFVWRVLWGVKTVSNVQTSSGPHENLFKTFSLNFKAFYQDTVLPFQP